MKRRYKYIFIASLFFNIAFLTGGFFALMQIRHQGIFSTRTTFIAMQLKLKAEQKKLFFAERSAFQTDGFRQLKILVGDIKRASDGYSTNKKNNVFPGFTGFEGVMQRHLERLEKFLTPEQMARYLQLINPERPLEYLRGGTKGEYEKVQ